MVETGSMKNSTSSQPHDEVFALLPWYVNRTLREDENDLVARHVEDCDICQTELTLLSQIDAVANEQDDVYTIPQNGFAHMSRTLDQDDAGEAVRPAAAGMFSRWRDTKWLGFKGFAVAVPALAGLAVASVIVWPMLSGHDPSYETLISGGSAEKDSISFKLALSGDAEKQLLRDYFRLVLNANVAVIDKEDGSYTIHLPPKTTPETMANIFKQLKRSEMIESVELVVE